MTSIYITHTRNKHAELQTAQRCYFLYAGHYLPCCAVPALSPWLLSTCVTVSVRNTAEDGLRAILTDGSDSQETTDVHPRPRVLCQGDGNSSLLCLLLLQGQGSQCTSSTQPQRLEGERHECQKKKKKTPLRKARQHYDTPHPFASPQED